jgi:probable HAF family extracellular repeat protein
MKSRFRILLAAITFFAGLALLFAGLALPLRLAAQDKQDHNRRHHHYELIDLGTFGGPASYFFNGFAVSILNNHGTAAGWADTSTPDPFPSFCFNPDCFVSHAFQWQSGVLTDLGTLAAGWSSSAFWISGNGLIVGNSQNGQIDPLVGVPETRAVLWQKGGITDLGTLEGGYESFGAAVNNGGQVVGDALNTIPDPFCLLAPGFCTTQTRAFLWQNGAMQDLGTLGGPDAIAALVNERSQIAGQSYTNSTPNPVTGLPTLDPFLWQNGTMLDLGTLGGTFGFPTALNKRGQVVGQSNLAGDLIFHPFLWTKSRGMQDLGTFGGDTGTTQWINDAGEVVGKADLPGSPPQNHDAFLWKDGVLTDLGTLPGDSCSLAYQVNSRGQVVGTSEDQALCLVPTGEHAFLWEHGGPMVDLNTLIPPGSALQLVFAFAINDRGEIAGIGVPPGCSPQDVDTCGHAYVLIPCGEGDESCVGANPTGVTQSSPASVAQRPSAATPANPALSGRGMLDRLRSRWGQRYQLPGRAFGPKD